MRDDHLRRPKGDTAIESSVAEIAAQDDLNPKTVRKWRARKSLLEALDLSRLDSGLDKRLSTLKETGLYDMYTEKT